MRRKLLSKRHLSTVFVVFLFLTLLTESLIIIYSNEQKNQLRKKVSDETNLLQMSLTNEISSSLNLVLGLTGYVKVAENMTDNDFYKIARVILRESEIIRNIGMAPDNIISYMYPLEGNEEAVGLDYMKNELQKDAVLKAIETGHITIAGPVELVQGGEGFIARIPIFKGDNRDDYWGIASIVVDAEKLYEKSGLSSDNGWIEYSLKGRDAEGEKNGKTCFTDEDLAG